MSETTDNTGRKKRRPYAISSPETWAKARASYLNGATAKAVAERFDLTVASVRARAKREGWTKREAGPVSPHAVMPPLFPDRDAVAAAETGGRPPQGPAELAREALAGVGRAMREGRPREAAELMRLAGQLQRAALEGSRKRWDDAQPEAEAAETVDEAATRRRALAAADRALAEGRTVEAGRLVRIAARLGGGARPPDSAGLGGETGEPLDAGQLSAATLAAAGSALRDGRASDARQLSAMAESLSRTAARGPGTSLEVIYRALTDADFRTELFRVDRDNPNDPDIRIKRMYWGRSPDSDW